MTFLAAVFACCLLASLCCHLKKNEKMEWWMFAAGLALLFLFLMAKD